MSLGDSIGSSLGRAIGSALSGGGWSPLSLFQAGEQGVWYDPSDFSTMFQDSAGATPVTAVEQPVGLILDKRMGLVRGAELVTNGTFDTNISGWSAHLGSSISWDAGTIVCAASAATNVLTYQNISTVAGQWYEVTVDRIASGGTMAIYVGTSLGAANLVNSGFTSGLAPIRAVFRATGATSVVQFVGPGANATGTLDNATVKAIPGNHASQATTAQKPTLKQDGAGKYYLLFDGVDDGLATAPIDFTATDKMTMIAGVRKLSDAAQGCIAELTASVAANNGSWLLAAPDAATATFAFDSKGTVQVDAVVSGNTAPTSAVLTGQADVSADTCSMRVNGVLGDTDAGDQGTGNYSNAALYIGRRGGASLPFSGHIYSLIVRGAATADVTAAEAYVAAKTGVTL